jgi:hypothetical protein
MVDWCCEGGVDTSSDIILSAHGQNEPSTSEKHGRETEHSELRKTWVDFAT